MSKANLMNDLKKIPGVGDRISIDFQRIGIHKTSDLEDRDPEELYQLLCDQKGTRIDRCMLYVLRCAVYYATAEPHDSELLKWWNWKD